VGAVSGASSSASRSGSCGHGVGGRFGGAGSSSEHRLIASLTRHLALLCPFSVYIEITIPVSLPIGIV
jgi:hypothetical protein